MKTKRFTLTMDWARRLWVGIALAVLLMPGLGMAQTNLTLGFTSPATNSAPGATFSDSINFAPTSMVLSATITAGSNVVPQTNLTLNAFASNTAQVTLIPLPNRSGSVSVQVQGITGISSNATTNTVSFSVVFKPYPPVLAPIADKSMSEDGSLNVHFTVSDPDTDLSTLTFTHSSTNTALIDTPQMVFGGSGANRILTLTPKSNINGRSRISVFVSDGQNSDTQRFNLVVNPVPDPSTINGLVNSAFGDNAGATNVFAGIAIDDVDHNMPLSEQLVATALLDTDQFAKFSNNQATFSYTGTPAQVTTAIANLSLQALPNRGAPGSINAVTASVRVRGVTDGIVVTNSIALSIEVINTPPTFLMTLNPTSVVEGIASQPFHVDYISDPDIGEEQFTLSISLVDMNQSNLVSIVPSAPLMDNIAGLGTAVQNVSVVSPSGVMTSMTEQIEIRFELADGYGGLSAVTNVLTLLQQQNAPHITGIAVQTINKTDADLPFVVYPTAFIQDQDQGGLQPVRATLTQSNPALGTFSVTNFPFMTPAQLSTSLQSVVYAPLSGALPVGQSAESTFTLTATDVHGLSAVNSSVKIHVTSVNSGPKIINVPALEVQPVLIPPAASIYPFAGLGLSNDDTNQVLFTLAMDNSNKGSLSNLGAFVQSGPGAFEMSGSVDAILGSLTNIAYILNPSYLFPPDDPGGTTFTLTARDYAFLNTVKTLYLQVQDEPRHHLVTRTLNDGLPGSFTYALANASNNDVITFALPLYPAVVRMPGSSANTLIRNVTIKGPGANLLTISGDGDGDLVPDRQIFRVRSRVTVEGITFAHGTAAFGGAMLVESNGFLTLRQSAIVDSVASQYGGAIDVDGGQLTLDGCFIARNRLLIDSGVGGAGVSVYSDKEIRIVNTTFAGNVQPNNSGDGGGALVVQNRTPSTPMSAYVTHSTFVDNVDAAGRASAAFSVDFGTRIRVLNSIFSDYSGRNMDVVGAGEIVSLGGNICDDTTKTTFYPDGFLDQASDLPLTDPLLAPLNLAGDPTPYREPLPGSPAIGLGAGSTTTVDQRGVLRQGVPDAGAVEFNALGRLVINEIFFDDVGVNFIEIYVRRDSTPIDLAPYSLFIDSVKIHDFADSTIIGTNSLYAVGDAVNTVINPGFGMLVAFTNGPFALTSTSNLTPVVGLSVTNALLDLPVQGILTIGQGGSQEPVVRQSYLGVYLSPSTGTNLLNTAGNSVSLAPQFRGFSLVPHSFILSGPFGGVDTTIPPATFPNSPGTDSLGTPFGQDNAEPLALPDLFTVTEDDYSALTVLANDFDGDGNDRLVVVDVSTVSGPDSGDLAVTSSQLGAMVQVAPNASPLRGARIDYDPRSSAQLQALPVGVEMSDTFYYEIIDIGSAPVENYSAAGTNTLVTSTHHRLSTGDEITLSDVSYGPYNGTFSVVAVDEDSFSIPVVYVDPVAVNGTWETTAARAPTTRSEAAVSVRVMGVNDTPVAVLDVITNVAESATVRLMTRPELAGTALSFPSDPVPTPSMLTQDLLSNDEDVDADDTWETLRVVGVLGSVNEITSYTGTVGAQPVTVHSSAHGLTSGTEVLIANYEGHPSYNGVHEVTVLDDDSFTIPRFYVDDHANRGVWVVLNESNRYDAVTDVEATVKLVLRADQQEDHLIYDASASAYLQGLAEGELYTNRLYYAVEDTHGGIGIGPLDVVVVGENNTPVALPDPDTLGQLGPLVNESNTLEGVLSDGLDLMYVLPAASGASGQADLYVLDTTGALPGSLVLRDFFNTDEDTPIDMAASDLLANDTDIDRIDMLNIIAIDGGTSRLNAALTLSGGVIGYDPTGSTNLQALVREEMVIDTFSVVVSDGMTGGTVTSLVAVLVTGVNDTPVANPAFFTTDEDEVFVFDPRYNDVDIDINGMEPDDRLGIVPVVDWPNPGQARVDMSITNVTHNAPVSELLNQLADWQAFSNVFNYTITDNSFIFAVDDEFYMPANTTNQVLDVLANDRDFTDAAGTLTIVDAGPALHGGTILIHSNGQQLVYSAPLDFVGDDYFRYVIENEQGDRNSGRVLVRSVVSAWNGVLNAAPDAFTVAAGETATLNVLGNDNMLPSTGAGLTITGIINSSIPGQPILTNNHFVYTATNGLAPLTFAYDVTAGGSSTARTDVVVNVIERRGTLRIQNDTFSVLPGSFDNELDVLNNDGLVTESITPLRIKQILDVPVGTLTTNAAGTRLLYTPPVGFIGTEQIRYVASDQIGGTGTGWVSIAVGRIEAVSDFYTIAATTNTVTIPLNVLANDRMFPNPKGSLTLVSVSPALPTAIGLLQVNGTGSHLLFTPSNQVGQLDFNYVVQDAGTPTQTATGRVTMATVPSGIYANPDRYVVRGGGSDYVLTVLTNDISYPNINKSYSILSIGTGADAPDHGGQVVIDGKTLVYTPAPGFFGEESFTYVMTDSVATDVARVTVSVRRGDLVANGDDYAVFYELESGTNIAHQFTLPVLLNDRIQPAMGQVMEIVALGVGTNAPNQGGTLAIAPDNQSLLYRPVLVTSTSYVEQFTYEISDGGDRRASGTVRVRVENRTSNLVAVTQNDAFTVARNSANNSMSVLANDFVLPGSATGWSVTAVSGSTYGGTATVSGVNVLYTPPTDFVGEDQFTYTVSDGLGGTGSAIVKVQVGSLPSLPDLFTVLSGSTDNDFDVVLNDVLTPAYADEYTLDSVFGMTHGGQASLSASNTVLYTPNAGYAGTYPYSESFLYRVTDDAHGAITGHVRVIVHEAGSDQSTSTITLLVEGRNDQPMIMNDPLNQAITDKQTIKPFVGVTIIEVDEQLMERIDVTVSLDLAAKGVLKNLGDFVDLGGGVYGLTNVTGASSSLKIRKLIFEPTENRITVPTTEPTTFTISVTDNKSAPVLDTQPVVQVTAVNDPPLISGTLANQKFYYRLPVSPFPTVTLTEVDDLTLQPLIVSVSIIEPMQGALSNLGSFLLSSNGVYIASNLTAAAATTQLRALEFTVGTNTVPMGGSQLTHFRLTVNDGFAPPVDDLNTSVIAHHPFDTGVRPVSPLHQGSFGIAVDAIADYAIVGAPNTSGHGNNSGMALVYQRDPNATNTWIEWRTLQPPTVTTNDRFGRAVSISEDHLAVSALNDDTGGANVGAVYVFERALGGANNWGELIRIVPTNLTAGAEFGWSVALDGDLLAVGAPSANLSGTNAPGGAVLLFGRHQGGPNAWGEIKRWAPTDMGSSNGLFGWSVSLSGDALVVGAPDYNTAGSSAVREGAAFLLSRNEGGTDNWGLAQTLTAVETNLSREFGYEVSVDGGLIAVGAPSMTAGAVTNAGRVFIYEKMTGTNTVAFMRELDRRTGVERRFGNSVSVSGRGLFIGAPYNSTAPNLGAAFLYNRDSAVSTNWTFIEKFTRPAGSTAGLYGTALRYKRGTAIVGAPADLSTFSNQGFAYLYRFDYNTPPVLVQSIPDQWGEVGQPFQYVIPPATFFDADEGDVLQLDAVFPDGHNGLFFDAGMITGTPVSIGWVGVTVTARDRKGDEVSTTFRIMVSDGVLLLGSLRDQWILEHFGNDITNSSLQGTVWGGSADPDSDSSDNDQEYVFAGDPNTADTSGIYMEPDADGHFVLTYVRRSDDPALSFVLQGTTNMVTWFDLTGVITSEISTALDAESEGVVLTVQVLDTYPILDYRIKAEVW